MSFTYRDGSRRTLEPWGMTSSKGRWYVIGRDVDRDATRMFKLSRMTDLPRRESKPGAYEVPADLDLRSLARALAPREPTAEAVLAAAARPRAGRSAAAAGPAAHRRRRGPRGFEVHVVAFGDLWLGRGGDLPLRRRRRRPRAGRAARARRRAAWPPSPAHGHAAARRRAGRHDLPGPGAPAAEPGALPPRARRGRDGRRGQGVRHQRRARCARTSTCCGCAACPGLTPGDLIDIDMDAVDGEGVIHLSNADYLTRPLRLSTDEALALVLGLRTLREIAGPGQRAAVDRALRKLEAASGSAPTDQASVSVTAGQDEIQARVNDGLQRGLRLDLTYDVASRAETTRRMVDPLRVFVLEGYGYLEAWCYSAVAPAHLPAGPDRGGRGDRRARSRRTTCVLKDLRDGLVRDAQGRPAGHPGPRARGRLGGRVLPDRGDVGPRRRRADGDPAGARPGLAARPAAGPARRGHRRRAGRRRATRPPRRPRRRSTSTRRSSPPASG